MQRNEVSERSPLRALERALGGGLGVGKIGVVAARHGTGKTAFLVGLALDVLLRGQSVLHVCLDHPLDKARAFYDDLFAELTHALGLEDVWRVHLEVERKRRIHALDAAAFGPAKLVQILRFVAEHEQFRPSVIVVDGWDFDQVSEETLGALREAAAAAGAELWMSAVLYRNRERNERGIPEPLARLERAIDVILTMSHNGKAVHVRLLKEHDASATPELKLALDPTTMLLVEE